MIGDAFAASEAYHLLSCIVIWCISVETFALRAFQFEFAYNSAGEVCPELINLEDRQQN